jgi:hypothetical protein
VKARSVIFFAEADQIADVKRRINEEVLPRFSDIPEFLGFVALQSEGSRPEVVAMSFWKEGLERSEAISEEFRDVIERVTGAALARKEFDIVKIMMRGPSGEVCLDLPVGGDAEQGDDAGHRCPLGHRLVEGPAIEVRPPTPVMFCPTCNARYRRQPDGTFVHISERPGHQGGGVGDARSDRPKF